MIVPVVQPKLWCNERSYVKVALYIACELFWKPVFWLENLYCPPNTSGWFDQEG